MSNTGPPITTDDDWWTAAKKAEIARDKERSAAIDRLWQDLLDKDDRTSPAEYPDMALITRDEFEGYLRSMQYGD